MIKALIAHFYVTGVFQKTDARVQGSRTWQNQMQFFLARSHNDSVSGNLRCNIKTISSITSARVKINMWKRKI